MQCHLPTFLKHFGNRSSVLHWVTRIWLLVQPNLDRLGETKSLFSKLRIVFANVSGIHWLLWKLILQLLPIVKLIAFECIKILRSTLPSKLWPQTGKVLNSNMMYLWRLPLVTVQLIVIVSQLLTSWIPSSIKLNFQ